MTRQSLSIAMKQGLVHETGLIAHGRGEAFDYLLGEQTIPPADAAVKVAAAGLLLADDPVLSVNGNVVALAADECIRLAACVPMKLEVNLFHRTPDRVNKIVQELKKRGAKRVYGGQADAAIPGLGHQRAVCDREGIFSADMVLVSLEDGDRCQALRDIGKTVIAIDLNPLSRTARTAHITIVDDVVRALFNLERWVKVLKKQERKKLVVLVESWDNTRNLRDVVSFISKRLNSIF